MRGRVLAVYSAPHGAEVARVEVGEVLRGDFEDEPGPLRVLCAAAGTIPRAGTEVVLLLRTLPDSGNRDLVQVAPLDDEDAGARLDAFRRYLALEAMKDQAAALGELRTWLRAALADPRRWSRWNAAREYASLAEAIPGALEAADHDALAKALADEREPGLRNLLRPLVEGLGPARPAAAARSPVGAEAAADLEALLRRVADASAPPAERRTAVIDAAARHGVRAVPVLEKALGDPEPAVREAAAAAAGGLGTRDLGSRLAGMLSTEPSPAVRRTLVVAVGQVRAESAVPTLAALARDEGPLAREAAFALARIRNPEAFEALRRVRSATRDAARAELYDFLLSPQFLEQENALRESR